VAADGRVWSRAGGGMVILTEAEENATFIGQVDDGMIAWVVSLADSIVAAVPIRRYVGSSFVEITSVPLPYVQGVPPYDFITYSGAACHGTTALLASSEQVDGTNTIRIFRSTDKGFTFTEVFSWEVIWAFKGQQFALAYNGDTEGSWWVNKGENPEALGTPGLFHSIDDGLTWTFVDTSTLDGVGSVGISSAKRVTDQES
jgi:hypothetical protein